VQNAIILWMHQGLDKASSFVESEVQNWPGSGSWLILLANALKWYTLPGVLLYS
jgi:hypothetical protein